MSKILRISNFKKNKKTLKDSKEEFIDDINNSLEDTMQDSTTNSAIYNRSKHTTEENEPARSIVKQSPKAKQKFDLPVRNKKILNNIPKDERFKYLSSCKEMDDLKAELVNFQDMTNSELREKLNRYHTLFIYLQTIHQRYIDVFEYD
jgi:hypothetical protein